MLIRSVVKRLLGRYKFEPEVHRNVHVRAGFT
jgi:hypothetical protein